MFYTVGVSSLWDWDPTRTCTPETFVWDSVHDARGDRDWGGGGGGGGGGREGVRGGGGRKRELWTGVHTVGFETTLTLFL